MLHKAHTAYRAAAAALVCALFCLLLPCHAAAQQSVAGVFTDRTVIPEGSTASILIKAASFGNANSITVNLRLSGTDQGRAVLSANTVALTAGSTTERQLTVFVADNEERQNKAETFSIMLEGGTNTVLSNTVLNFTIPPNDLDVLPKTLEGTLRSDRTISLVPEQFTIADLQAPKTFVVSSTDTRINVQTGIITTQDSFSVLLNLREGRTAAEGEAFSLTISHLDAFNPSARRAAQIDGGSQHFCAVAADSTVKCWGVLFNQIRPISSISEQGGPITENDKFLAVSAGHAYSCGIKTDNTLACWGSTSNETRPTSSRPDQGGPVHADTRFLAVSAGEHHTCGIKADGTLACWGSSRFNRTSPTSSRPEQGGPIHADTRFLAVGIGKDHSCAVKADGTTACWGGEPDNDRNAANPSSSPQGVDQNTRFLALSTGEYHNCAIKEDGTMACWGTAGQTDPTASPQGVSTSTRFLAVSAGTEHICAIKTDGTLACWGGIDNLTSSRPDQGGPIKPDDKFLAVGAAQFGNCAVRIEGAAACWGSLDIFATTLTAPVDFQAQIIPDAVRLHEKSEQAEVTVSIPPIGVFTDKPIVPEGSSASILIKLESIFTPAAEILLTADPPDRAVLSTSSLVLTPDAPSALVEVSVADNQQAEADGHPFSIQLASSAKLSLSRLDFTVPPNDLELRVQDPAVFSFSDNSRTITLSAASDLKSSKTFAVSFGDDRFIIPAGFIMTHNQSPFPMTVQLKEGAARLTESLDLAISHLDAFSRDSAEISAGGSHTCAIRTDGAPACWGFSANGRTNPATSPQGVNQNTRFLAVSAGGSHNCAVRTDGSMACWGSSADGQTDPTASPQGVDQNTRFLAVSAGGSHACAVRMDGTMACWGDSADDRTDPTASLQGVSTRTRFLALSAGDSHTCAIRTDGTPACWGDSADDRTDPTASPQGVSTRTRFLALSAGGSHTCAIRTDGSMACWGSSADDRTDPTASLQGVDQNTQFLAVSAGGSHSCGIKMDGSMACWGRSSRDRTDPNSSPQNLSTSTRFLAVSAGRSHSCAVKTDGAAACWGFPGSGRTNPPAGFKAQIAPDAFYLFEQEQVLEDAVMPMRVELHADRPIIQEGTEASILVKTNQPAAVSLSLSKSDPQDMAELSVSSVQLTKEQPAAMLSLSLADNDTRNTSSRALTISMSTEPKPLVELQSLSFTIPPDDLSLMAGKAEFAVGRPVQTVMIRVPGLEAEKTFIVSSSDTRIIVPAGFITASDQNPFSVAVQLREGAQLGKEESLDLSIAHLDSFTRIGAEISSGLNHACAVKEDGAMACWGLADDDRTDPSSSPDIDQDARFLAVSAGEAHNCAIKEDNTMACWGDSANDRTKPSSNPQLNQNTRFLAVSAGGFHTCAVRIDNTMACWGLSDDNQTDPSSAEGVDQNTKFLAVSAGRFHNCAVKTDGAMACWGFPGDGDGRTDPSSSGQNVNADTRFLGVIEGYVHTCAVKEDGSAACWGSSGREASPPSGAFLALSTGSSHTCGIRIDRTMACWGDSSHGQTNPSSNPQLNQNTRFLAVGAGGDHTCAVKEDGTAACWGDDEFGATTPPDTFERAETVSDTIRLFERAQVLEDAVALEDLKVEAYPDRFILPEGTTVSILIRASQPATVSLVLTESDSSTMASLSASSVQLNKEQFSRTVSLSAAGNDAPQADKRTVTVRLTAEPEPEVMPDILSFIVPPNDLELSVQDTAVFSFSDASRTMILSAAPDLMSSKTFAVSFSDSRLSVPDSFIISRNQNPFPMTVQFREGARPTEFLDLTISHLDAYSRDSAEISAGTFHTCAVREDGAMACWGFSLFGQADPTASPQGVDQNTRFLAVSAADKHTCAIRIDGTMACWGDSGDDRTDPTSSPQGVHADTRFLAVSTGSGGSYSCAIKTDGTMACWGGSGGNETNPRSSRHGVNADTRFLAVAAGNIHTCAIKTDGTMACWGDPSFGLTRPTESLQDVNADTRFLAVSAGGQYSCAVKEDGTMACWGLQSFGRTDPTASPQGVNADTRFLAVSAGSRHSCGIRADGTMACWGDSFFGQTDPTASPQGVDQNTRFLAVNAGNVHTCAVKEDRTAACWGDSGDVRANHPPTGFKAQIIPKAFYLFEQEQVLADAVKRAAEIEVLHPELEIGEGETVKRTLFEATESLNTTITVTMRTMNNDSVMLDPAFMQTSEFMPSTEVRVKISLTELSGEVTITAIDDESYSSHEPVVFTLLTDDESIPLVPVTTMKITIEGDEFHTLSFSTDTLILEEGSTSTVMLIMTTESTETIAITLMSPNADQLKFIDGQGSPEGSLELSFSAEQRTQNVVLRAERDKVPEPRDSYPISVLSEEELRISTPLTVIIPAQGISALQVRIKVYLEGALP